MAAKKTRIETLLFGDRVSSLLSQAEFQNFDPDRVVVLASDGSKLKVFSTGMTHFEVLGVLVAALDAVQEEGQGD